MAKKYERKPNPKKIEQQKEAFTLGQKQGLENPKSSEIKTNPELKTLLNRYINKYWQSDILSAYIKGFYAPTDNNPFNS